MLIPMGFISRLNFTQNFLSSRNSSYAPMGTPQTSSQNTVLCNPKSSLHSQKRAISAKPHFSTAGIQRALTPLLYFCISKCPNIYRFLLYTAHNIHLIYIYIYIYSHADTQMPSSTAPAPPKPARRSLLSMFKNSPLPTCKVGCFFGEKEGESKMTIFMMFFLSLFFPYFSFKKKNIIGVVHSPKRPPHGSV